MTEFCMYQVEDLVWDDISQYDNHGVPCLIDAHVKEHSFSGNSLKRTLEEADCVASDAGDLFIEEPMSQENVEMETFTAYDGQNEMLEKEGWSKKSDGVVSSCNDESIKEESSLVSGGTRTSNKRFQISEASRGSELCDNDPSLSERNAADVNSFGDPLDRVSGPDNGLTFFGNNCEDRGCNDFLYYDWQDIGNFEDVDRMFRSCNSTFALGTRNEDDLGWYSSLDAFGRSKFSCPESSALETVDGVHASSRLNGSNCSDNKDELAAEQFDEQEKQLKHKNQAEGSKHDHQQSENRSSFHVDDILVPAQQQKRKSNSNEYLQNDTPYLSSDKCHPSENSNLTFLFPKDSYPSNLVNSNEGLSSPITSVALVEKRGNPLQEQGIMVSFNHDIENMDSTISGTTSMENLVSCPGGKFKTIADDGVDMEIPGGYGSIKQEISSMSSGLDDISKEVTGFCQFQLVIGRLDSRTKLCIRDSLYRLAWSAEQRHNSLKLNGGNSDGRDVNGVLSTEGTNMYNGFMDIESETNPIDRSMAHLLFHRPGHPSVMPGQNSVSLTSSVQESF